MDKIATVDTRRFVLVPADNAFNANARTSSFDFLSSISGAAKGMDVEPLAIENLGDVRVIDSVDLNEATLVEMSSEQAAQFQNLFPSLLVAPEGVLRLLRARMFDTGLVGNPPPAGKRNVTLIIQNQAGEPVPNAQVDVAVDPQRKWHFTDLMTDAEGRVTFSLQPRWDQLDLIIVTPRAGYWGATATLVALDGDENEVLITVAAIDDDHEDSLQRVVGPPDKGDGKGVRVAVIDAGVSLPPEVRVEPGINTVDGEASDEVGDNGTGHGSHVAGIVHRVAPGATIVAYRVCGANSSAALELPIAKAIRHAVDNNCDVINLSLGQDSEPIAVTREVRRARSLGCVVVAATGNDWGAPVCYPARTMSVLAVTACGHHEGAPKGVVAADVSTPPPEASDGVYFAKFSNTGEAVDFLAPGVGVVSFVSATEKGVMDGTSMSAPAVSGLIARLLSGNDTVLKSDRTQQRSDDIVSECHKVAKAFGFGREFEGSGLLIC